MNLAMKTLAVLLFVSICLEQSHAQTQGVGQRLAQDALALVGYIELGNIGSSDPDCKDVKFETGNVNTIVDKEVAPLLRLLQKKDSRSKNSDISELLNQLRSLPQQKQPDGRFILRQVYAQKKSEAAAAYGVSQGCIALAVAFRTVVQQRRISMRDTSELLR